jgi:hypothetical protein
MNRRSIAACAFALAFTAVSGRVASAQARGQDHGQDSTGVKAAQNGSESNRRDPDEDVARQHHTAFNDEDRRATHDWYQQHQTGLGAGWRQEDRLSPDMERRLRTGQHLDSVLKEQMHPLPDDLLRRYGAAPNGYAYGVIGGNVVMLDGDEQVHDVFRADGQSR